MPRTKLKWVLPFLLLALIFLQAQVRKKYKRRVYSNQYVDLMEKKHLQIESNIIYENNHEFDNIYLTDNRIRYGLNDDLEIFSDIDLVYSKDQGYGLLPLGFGLKVNIKEETKYFPDISFLGSLQTSNISSKKFVMDNPLPMFTFIFQKQLGEKIGFEADYSMQWLNQVLKPSHIFELAASYQLSDKISASLGLINFTNENDATNFITEIGFSGDVNKNLSIALEVGKYYDHIDQNYYIGFGIIKNFSLNIKQ